VFVDVLFATAPCASTPSAAHPPRGTHITTHAPTSAAIVARIDALARPRVARPRARRRAAFASASARRASASARALARAARWRRAAVIARRDSASIARARVGLPRVTIGARTMRCDRSLARSIDRSTDRWPRFDRENSNPRASIEPARANARGGHSMPPPARAPDAADVDDDDLEREYAILARCLRARADAVRDKPTRIRVRAWCQHLDQRERVRALRENRNAHARLLLEMLRATRSDAAPRLARPFDRAPPSGRVGRFCRDDAVGWNLTRRVVEDDVEREIGGGARERAKDACVSVSVSGDGEDARAEEMRRMVEIEASASASASRRVSRDDAKDSYPAVVVARERPRDTRRVEELETELKKLQAKSERQTKKINALKEELATERRARSNELQTVRAKHEREMRDLVASVSGVQKSNVQRRRRVSSNEYPPPPSRIVSGADEFDAFIAGFAAETDRLRKTLEHKRFLA
jgi:hypothetical protein